MKQSCVGCGALCIEVQVCATCDTHRRAGQFRCPDCGKWHSGYMGLRCGGCYWTNYDALRKRHYMGDFLSPTDKTSRNRGMAEANSGDSERGS
jgi:predicted amidophosphoribosyltransferase